MTAYACYSLFLTAWVYPVMVRMIWSVNGHLSAFRVEGSTVPIINGTRGLVVVSRSGRWRYVLTRVHAPRQAHTLAHHVAPRPYPSSITQTSA